MARGAFYDFEKVRQGNEARQDDADADADAGTDADTDLFFPNEA